MGTKAPFAQYGLAFAVLFSCYKYHDARMSCSGKCKDETMQCLTWLKEHRGTLVFNVL